MKLPAILAALLLASAAPTRAADAPQAALTSTLATMAGDWDATLAAPGQVLAMTLHLRPEATPQATLDIPLQGLRGGALAVSSAIDGVAFTLGNGAVFRLRPDPGAATLEGLLLQNGAALPILFRKRAAVSAASMAGETAVQVAGPLGPIKGSLALTQGAPKAAAVLIQGSGPTDRNGDNPLGSSSGTMRLLASAMADQGILSIRYDKRGQFASSTAIGDPNKVTMEELAADARDFASLAAQRAGQPCAWLVGHSEGALVALIAAQQPSKICGLVLVAGAGRRMGDILKAQLAASAATAPPDQKAMVDAQLAQANAAIARLQMGRKVDTANMSDSLLSLFDASVQDFIIDQMRYDPPKLAGAYKGPILVVQGDNDLQISMTDADLLANARPGIERATIAGANHELKPAPTERAANLATYADPNLPLAPGIAPAITGFILRQR